MFDWFKPKTKTIDPTPAWLKQYGSDWSDRMGDVWSRATTQADKPYTSYSSTSSSLPSTLQKQQKLRDLGYAGSFGSGGAQSWINEGAMPTDTQKQDWLRSKGYAGEFGGGGADAWIRDPAQSSLKSEWVDYINTPKYARPEERSEWINYINTPQSQRVAPLSYNQNTASGAARTMPGVSEMSQSLISGAMPAYSSASDYITKSTTPYSGGTYAGGTVTPMMFSKDFDAATYMNPFIGASLDPTARELREESARKKLADASTAVSKGAFGGSRSTISELERDEQLMQGLSDLYKEGYSTAYDKGVQSFENDADRKYSGDVFNVEEGLRKFMTNYGVFDDERKANQEAAKLSTQIGGELVGSGVTLSGNDRSNLESYISSLLTTGGQSQSTDQAARDAEYDAEYEDYLREQRYDVDMINLLINAVGGQPQAMGLQTTSTGSPIAQIGGLASSVVGAGSKFGLF